MAERIQKTVHHTERVQEEIVEETVAPRESNIDTDEIDRLLNEIDLVLEENAAEFVEKFQQRGGQ